MFALLSNCVNFNICKSSSWHPTIEIKWKWFFNFCVEGSLRKRSILSSAYLFETTPIQSWAQLKRKKTRHFTWNFQFKNADTKMNYKMKHFSRFVSRCPTESALKIHSNKLLCYYIVSENKKKYTTIVNIY